MDFKKLCVNDLYEDVLKNFKRIQVVKQRYVYVEKEIELKDVDIVYDWSDEVRVFVRNDLIEIINQNGLVIGGYENTNLKAFIAVDKSLWGSKNQYIELKYIHVSNEYRGSGTGKKLFNMIINDLRDMKNKKLYISANSSKESIDFYKNIGCILAEEVKEEYLDVFPNPIQLEYNLKNI